MLSNNQPPNQLTENTPLTPTAGTPPIPQQQPVTPLPQPPSLMPPPQPQVVPPIPSLNAFAMQNANQSEVYLKAPQETNKFSTTLLRSIILLGFSLLAILGSAFLPDIINNDQSLDVTSSKEPSSNQVLSTLDDTEDEEPPNSQVEEDVESQQEQPSIIEEDQSDAPPAVLLDPEPEIIVALDSSPVEEEIPLINPEPPVIAPTPISEIAIPIDPAPEINPVDAEFNLVSQEIKNLANQLDLTDISRRVLYEYNPQIHDDPNNNACLANLEITLIYGCWTLDSIQILRSSTMETTLAHEMLHAIYYNLYLAGEIDQINQYIDDFIEENEAEVEAVLKVYEDRHANEEPEIQQWVRYNELHSFIGTQFVDIPEELEVHYAQYFNNRQVVVDFYDNWQQSVTKKLSDLSTINAALNNQYQQFNHCYSLTQSTAQCQPYQADLTAYTNYIKCLESVRTLFNECLQIKPVFTAYRP